MIYFKRDEEFDDFLKPAAKKYGVPLWLAKGLISTESAWNPDAATYEPSHQNTPQPGDRDVSFGLMQVTASVAEDFKVPIKSEKRMALDGKTYKFYDLDDARKIGVMPMNADLGMRELGQKLKRYGGNIGDTVAAYNMGFPRKIAQGTMFIAKIYDKWALDQGYGSYIANFEKWKANPPAGWIYANQPYVNVVLAHAAMYRAAEEGKTAEVAAIRTALKKNIWEPLFGSISSLSRVVLASSSPLGWLS